MQERHYKTILYFIITTILVTLAIQGYWSYKNYQTSKQQLINDVQISLDNAVNNYYAEKTQKRFKEFTFVRESKSADSILNILKSHSVPKELNLLDSLSKIDDTEVKITIDVSDSKNDVINRLKVIKSLSQDTIDLNNTDIIFTQHIVKDSLYNNPFAQLTSAVMYKLAAKSIELSSIDSLLIVEFKRKNISVGYSLYFQNPFGKDQSIEGISDGAPYLSTQSNSAFLPEFSFLQINFANITGAILRKNIFGLLLSFIFVFSIIGCLLYLLKIIKNQKQLAEIKNDLISNITHEFKTPLTTIGAAMEGLQLFNKNNDVEKTQRYAQVSASQVSKLNTMVEKLLETATLDSKNLELNKEEIDLVHLLETITAKESVLAIGKTISFKTEAPIITYSVDTFHFENALNNLIDNAIKYGGNQIEVSIAGNKNGVEIEVSDNGNELTTAQSKQIFEKFYRVPKGNTHDIKGFGIGLYYSKKIIEKHQGTISLLLNKKTTFKITLPDAS